MVELNLPGISPALRDMHQLVGTSGDTHGWHRAETTAHPPSWEKGAVWGSQSSILTLPPPKAPCAVTAEISEFGGQNCPWLYLSPMKGVSWVPEHGQGHENCSFRGTASAKAHSQP